ncbi:MAG: flagellar hook-length control protein FliK [Gammaproteobacteria bacterium]|nr:flagellar hook-length control protein FliK [Gammaproteobacteria bacterium]
MFIQQSAQTAIGIIQDTPKQLLADLSIGQRLEAVIIKSTLAAELVQIRLADSVLNIRTPQALQSGQTIKLEVVLEHGKPALKFIAAVPIVKTSNVLAKAQSNLIEMFKIGQQLPVEVVKILADNKILVRAELNQFKQAIEVDVSQLLKQYKVGDKATLDVAGLKPLQVYIQPDNIVNKQHIITNKIQQLVREQGVKPNLSHLITTSQQEHVPESVKHEIQSLLRHTLDKSALTEGHAFKQALINSGVFTEKQLMSEPVTIKQDFKANIIKLMVVLKTVIDQGNLTNNDEVRSLLNKLPAQVQSALASTGRRTPQQLLSVLLSSANRLPIETALSPSVSPIISDPKQAVLLAQLITNSLNKQLQTTISQLQMMMRDMVGVHNKLLLNQMAMLKEPDSATTMTQASWLFDLPIKDKQNLDLVQLKIDRDKDHLQSEQQGEDIWNVQLRLDTQNLGPLEATLTLDQQDLKIVFRAERASSAGLLEQNLGLLQQALVKMDVTISHISCSCGEVSQRSLTESAIQSSSLLDVLV